MPMCENMENVESKNNQVDAIERVSEQFSSQGNVRNNIRDSNFHNFIGGSCIVNNFYRSASKSDIRLLDSKVRIGAYGYAGEGISFSLPGYDGIKKIIIYVKSLLQSIEVQYSNDEQISEKIGPKDGKREEFVFDDDEYLVEVKGFYGVPRLYRMGAITSITLVSNKKKRTYGNYKGTDNTNRIEGSEPTPFQIKGGKITGFHGSQEQYFLSSIGFDIERAKVCVEPVYMEACGYPGEENFYHIGYDGIKKIILNCECMINSMEVHYTKNGNIKCTNRVGGEGGNCKEIVFEDGEYLTEVKGYYGHLNNMDALSCITFISNLKRIFGPYGSKGAIPMKKTFPFSLKGGKIIGFHGSNGPNCITAIGLYMNFHPNASIMSTSRWGNPNVGTPFDHKRNDGIKRIVIYCGWIIDTIEVQYRNNGQLNWNKIEQRGGNRKEFVLDDDEYLTEVEGFYGRLFDRDTINSLTFFSNKRRRFGPYGIDEGTQREESEEKPTSFHVKDGKIVGFHGTMGNYYLASIGFHLAPVESPSENISTEVSIEPPIYMGACGYPGEGVPFDHSGYDGIKKIIIYSGFVVDSIEVEYTRNGGIEWVNKVGGKGGNREEIILEDGEYLTEVIGYYGRLGKEGALTCIKFVSNLSKQFGPYGNDRNAPLKKKSPFEVKGGKISGFHGYSGKNYLSALGFYVAFHPDSNTS